LYTKKSTEPLELDAAIAYVLWTTQILTAHLLHVSTTNILKQ